MPEEYANLADTISTDDERLRVEQDRYVQGVNKQQSAKEQYHLDAFGAQMANQTIAARNEAAAKAEKERKRQAALNAQRERNQAAYRTEQEQMLHEDRAAGGQRWETWLQGNDERLQIEGAKRLYMLDGDSEVDAWKKAVAYIAARKQEKADADAEAKTASRERFLGNGGINVPSKNAANPEHRRTAAYDYIGANYGLSPEEIDQIAPSTKGVAPTEQTLSDLVTSKLSTAEGTADYVAIRTRYFFENNYGYSSKEDIIAKIVSLENSYKNNAAGYLPQNMTFGSGEAGGRSSATGYYVSAQKAQQEALNEIQQYKDLLDAWDSIEAQYTAGTYAIKEDFLELSRVTPTQLKPPESHRTTYYDDGKKYKLCAEICGEEYYLSGYGNAVGNQKDGVFLLLNGKKYELDACIRLVEYLTEQEKQTYTYIANTQGLDAASDYFGLLLPELDQRKTAADSASDEAYAQAHPVWATILSIPVGFYEALVSAGYNTNTRLHGADILQSAQPAKSDRWVSTVSDTIDSPVGSFLYQTGMSIIDSAVIAGTTYLSGGTAAAAWMGSAVLGAKAFNSTLQDALSRGVPSSDCYTLALLSGIAECVFEKVSIGKWLETPNALGAVRTAVKGKTKLEAVNTIAKEVSKIIAKQGIVETSEEVFTEIANIIFDTAIAGQKSNYELMIAKFMQEPGVSRSEAERLAKVELAKQVGLAGLGGLVSGVFMGAGGLTLGWMSSKTDTEKGRIAKQEKTVTALLAKSLELPKDSRTYLLAVDMYGRLQNTTNSAKNTDLEMIAQRLFTDKEVGKLCSLYARETGMSIASDDDNGVMLPSIEDARPSTAKTTATAEKTGATSPSPLPNVDDYLNLTEGVNEQSGIREDDSATTLRSVEAAKELKDLPVKNTFTKNGITYSQHEKGFSKLSKKRKAFIRVLEVMSRKFGTKYTLHDVLGPADGYYDPNSNTVHIALNTTSLSAALAHELTHHFQNTSQNTYAALRDFLISECNKEDAEAFNKLLDEMKEIYGDAQAEDEAIASLCEELLNNEELIMKVCRQNRTLAQKIVGFLMDLLEDIKKAFANDVKSEYSGMVSDLEKALGLWLDCLDESSKADSSETSSDKDLQLMFGGPKAQGDTSKYKRFSEPDSPNGAKDTFWFTDRSAKLNLAAKRKMRTGQFVPITDLLEHKALFSHYPYLKNYTVSVEELGSPDRHAVCNSDTRVITFNYAYLDTASNDEVTGTLLHELQHAVDAFEGRDHGSNLSIAALEIFIDNLVEKAASPEFANAKTTTAKLEVLATAAPEEDLQEYIDAEWQEVYARYEADLGETKARRTKDNYLHDTKKTRSQHDNKTESTFLQNNDSIRLSRSYLRDSTMAELQTIFGQVVTDIDTFIQTSYNNKKLRALGYWMWEVKRYANWGIFHDVQSQSQNQKDERGDTSKEAQTGGHLSRYYNQLAIQREPSRGGATQTVASTSQTGRTDASSASTNSVQEIDYSNKETINGTETSAAPKEGLSVLPVARTDRRNSEQSQLPPDSGRTESFGMARRGDSGSNYRALEIARRRRALSAADVPNLGLTKTADSTKYSEALALMRAENEEGAAVDPKTPEELEGNTLLLTDDGTAGAAITKDGYLTAVFKNKFRNNTPGAIRDLTLNAIARGATHGDCYGAFLMNGYASGGFIPVARVAYARGFNPDMDAYIDSRRAKGKSNFAADPDIYFFVLPSDYVFETAITELEQGKFKQYTQAELDALPSMDYEQAEAEIEGLLNGERTGSGVNAETRRPVLNNGQPLQKLRSDNRESTRKDLNELAQAAYDKTYKSVYDTVMASLNDTELADKLAKEAAEKARSAKVSSINSSRKRADTAKMDPLDSARQARNEQRAKGKASQERARLLDKIREQKADLDRLLLKPEKDAYVPRELVTAVADICRRITDITNNSKSLEKVLDLNRLKLQYEKLKADKDFQYDYDENIVTALASLIDAAEFKALKDMSNAELRYLRTIIQAVYTTVRNASKLVKSQISKSAREAGEAVIGEVRANKKVGAFPLNRFSNSYKSWALQPIRFFRYLSGYKQDSVLVQLAEELNQGEVRSNTIKKDGLAYFSDLAKKNTKALARFQGPNAELIETGWRDREGKPVRITKAMRVSLYLSSLNSANRTHMLYGGLTIPDIRLYKKGKFRDAMSNGQRVYLTEDLLDGIWETMTPLEQEFAERAKQFFNEYTRDLVNETSLNLLGYKKATVVNYFPIKSDRNFVQADFDTVMRNGSIQGLGMLKNRVVGAANPIYLEDVTQVILRQLDDVALYAGLAIPVRNLTKIWNTNFGAYDDSVRSAVTQQFGQGAEDRVEDLLADLQRKSGGSATDKFFSKITSNFAQAVLSANISVGIKQAASLPTAAAELGWGPLLRSLGNIGKVDQELISKYTPLLWMRTQGLIDRDIGEIASKKGWVKKLPLMSLIQKIDVATVSKLWKASEYYVRSKTSLERKSDAYYKEVAKTFNRMVQNTQPNFSIMQRPAVLRQTGAVKMFTMFMTQRLQNGAILIDAASDFQAQAKAYSLNKNARTRLAKKTAAVRLTNAMTSQLASAVTISLMTALARALLHKLNPYRDEDDGSLEADENFFGQLIEDAVSSLAGSFLGGSEAFELIYSSIIKGESVWDIETPVASVANELRNSVSGIRKAISRYAEGKDSNMLGAVYDMLVAITKVYPGLPVENIYNILRGVYLSGLDAINGEFGTFNASHPALKNEKVAAAYNAALGTGMAGAEFFLQLNELKLIGTAEERTESGLRAEYLYGLEMTGEQKRILAGLVLSDSQIEKLDGAITSGISVDTMLKYLTAEDATKATEERGKKEQVLDLLINDDTLSATEKETIERLLYSEDRQRDYTSPEWFALSSDKDRYEKAKCAVSDGIPVEAYYKYYTLKSDLYNEKQSDDGPSDKEMWRRDLLKDRSLTVKQKQALEEHLYSNGGKYACADYTSTAWFELSVLPGCAYEDAEQAFGSVGIQANTYYEFLIKYRGLDAKNDNGESVSGLKKQRTKELLDSLNLTDAQWKYLWTQCGYK